MQFYTQQRQFYCGIDLHATCMFVCVLDERGWRGEKGQGGANRGVREKMR
jgi:hypothetical protein